MFEGFPERECGEHRTTGMRAWCHDCTEWCYQAWPCKGCEIVQLRKKAERSLRSSWLDAPYVMLGLLLVMIGLLVFMTVRVYG